MMNYLISLAVGFGVGALYALLHMRSPAPPLIALLGLFRHGAGRAGADAVALSAGSRSAAFGRQGLG